MRFPWFLAGGFLVIPRPLRDWCYGLISRNRYRWFGRRETCRLPTQAERDRFLEDEAPSPPR
jgi:predicted DCC family thiol-disulfide oxidoreductase YuxK